MKCAVLTGVAAMAFAVGAPAQATWGSSGWGSSGWGSSGWGSSGWGSSGGVNTGSSGGTPVPEPSSMLMLGFGLSGLVAGRVAAKRRKKN
tara:strand:- start:13691 stop:13960 length:270 start_codon:yes stop_codon:yes gene_type:complete